MKYFPYAANLLDMPCSVLIFAAVHNFMTKVYFKVVKAKQKQRKESRNSPTSPEQGSAWLSIIFSVCEEFWQVYVWHQVTLESGKPVIRCPAQLPPTGNQSALNLPPRNTLREAKAPHLSPVGCTWTPQIHGMAMDGVMGLSCCAAAVVNLGKAFSPAAKHKQENLTQLHHLPNQQDPSCTAPNL